MKVGDRLNAIEEELAEIEAALSSSRPPGVVKLKWLWKVLKMDEADIVGAKKVPLQKCLRLDSSTSLILKQLNILLSLASLVVCWSRLEKPRAWKAASYCQGCEEAR